MDAFELAKKMDKEEILEKIKAAGLREYGVFNQDLAQKWAQDPSAKVIAALNNNDTDRALLKLLHTHAGEIIFGMQIAAHALGAERMELYLPEGEEALKAALAHDVEEAGIVIREGLVDVRAERESSLNHIQTMLFVGELFSGSYSPSTWIALSENGVCQELRKVSFPVSVRELTGAEPGEIKGVMIGSRLYDASGLDMMLEADTNIGNGVITLLPKTCCILDYGKRLLLEERKNGCGKCTFCREGLGQLHLMTKEITEGMGKNDYVGMLEEIGNAMTFSCQCSVGLRGADFTLGSLACFPEEYTDHIKKKKCAVNVCSAFMSIYIDPNACEGCEDCAGVCPVGCIEGKSGFIHMIDEFECTKCGKCIEACEYDAIVQTAGRAPKLPTRLVKCGKFKKR